MILTAIIVYIMYRGFRKKKKSVSSLTGGISAFAKIAETEVKQKEAEGKIIAVECAAKAKRLVAATLKEAALAAHAAINEADKAFNEVHEILG